MLWKKTLTRILLDTVTLVWWLKQDKRLGEQASLIITNPAHSLFVSSFSVFEWQLKARIKKMKYYPDLEERIRANGFSLLDYSSNDSRHIPGFTDFTWNDPFDFGLISQSIARNLAFMTSDNRILAESGALMKCIDARK